MIKQVKRFVSILCAFAILLTMLYMPSSAEESSQFSLYFQWINADGSTSQTGSRPIEEGFLLPNGVIGIRIIGFGIRPTLPSKGEFVQLIFRVSGYSSNTNDMFQLDISNVAKTLPCSNYSQFSYQPNVIVFGTGRTNVYPDQTAFPSLAQKTATFNIRFRVDPVGNNTTARFDLTTPFDIVRLSGTYWWPYLDNIFFETINANEVDYYDLAITYMAQILNQVGLIGNAVLRTVYSYNQISYDVDTGMISLDTLSGNWFEAVLGTLKSLNADAEAQAAQQEKANDAGAGDALDGAFDRVGSGFGSIGDIGDVGGLAPYNDNAIGNASNGLLHWFSEQTRQSIDNVQANRSDNLDIIDFYHIQVGELEEVLQDGAADP